MVGFVFALSALSMCSFIAPFLQSRRSVLTRISTAVTAFSPARTAVVAPGTDSTFASNVLALHSNERTVEVPLIQRRLVGWRSRAVARGVAAMAAGTRQKSGSALERRRRIVTLREKEPGRVELATRVSIFGEGDYPISQEDRGTCVRLERSACQAFPDRSGDRLALGVAASAGNGRMRGSRRRTPRQLVGTHLEHDGPHRRGII